MNIQQGFAVWLTGIPASGKSSITKELVKKLRELGIAVVVLESDEMRAILTPEATYGPEERDRFYRTLVSIGEMITRNGISVVFDATANKRHYRDHARSRISKFAEAYVRCSLEVCVRRDPKGIYHRAAAGETQTVPGLQSPYEPPLYAEITLDGQDTPIRSANTILAALKKLNYI
ncbi:MAG TPA: adenylyl-sulfate kinase [Nitrospirota bacterium]|nr:adenylyl-sulfate kinase [Nitrospirota bacterium]